MDRSLHLVRLAAAAALAIGFGSFDLDATPAAGRDRAAALYAIRGAKIVPVAGAVVDKGTVVMRDGVIIDVGANAAVPADAVDVRESDLDALGARKIDACNACHVSAYP